MREGDAGYHKISSSTKKVDVLKEEETNGASGTPTLERP